MRQHAENLRSTSVPKPAKWCPGRDLNPHFPCEKKDFKTGALESGIIQFESAGCGELGAAACVPPGASKDRQGRDGAHGGSATVAALYA